MHPLANGWTNPWYIQKTDRGTSTICYGTSLRPVSIEYSQQIENQYSSQRKFEQKKLNKEEGIAY